MASPQVSLLLGSKHLKCNLIALFAVCLYFHSRSLSISFFQHSKTLSAFICTENSHHHFVTQLIQCFECLCPFFQLCSTRCMTHSVPQRYFIFSASFTSVKIIISFLFPYTVDVKGYWTQVVRGAQVRGHISTCSCSVLKRRGPSIFCV